MPALDILIKPASSRCNMGCKYCFYRDVAESRNKASSGIMSEETTRAFLKTKKNTARRVVFYLANQDGKTVIKAQANQ